MEKIKTIIAMHIPRTQLSRQSKLSLFLKKGKREEEKKERSTDSSLKSKN